MCLYLLMVELAFAQWLRYRRRNAMNNCQAEAIQRKLQLPAFRCPDHDAVPYVEVRQVLHLYMGQQVLPEGLELRPQKRFQFRHSSNALSGLPIAMPGRIFNAPCSVVT